jgi:hypothetical protein
MKFVAVNQRHPTMMMWKQQRLEALMQLLLPRREAFAVAYFDHSLERALRLVGPKKIASQMPALSILGQHCARLPTQGLNQLMCYVLLQEWERRLRTFLTLFLLGDATAPVQETERVMEQPLVALRETCCKNLAPSGHLLAVCGRFPSLFVAASVNTVGDVLSKRVRDNMHRHPAPASSVESHIDSADAEKMSIWSAESTCKKAEEARLRQNNGEQRHFERIWNEPP